MREEGRSHLIRFLGSLIGRARGEKRIRLHCGGVVDQKRLAPLSALDPRDRPRCTCIEDSDADVGGNLVHHPPETHIGDVLPRDEDPLHRHGRSSRRETLFVPLRPAPRRPDLERAAELARSGQPSAPRAIPSISPSSRRTSYAAEGVSLNLGAEQHAFVSR